MSILPFPFDSEGQLLGPRSWESLGNALAAEAQSLGTGTAYPLGNLSLLVPFVVPRIVVIRSVWWRNGTGTGGNCDVGIYASNAQTLIASLGTTGKGAASTTVYTAAFADTTLEPGLYYMAFAHDSTGNFIANASAAGYWAGLGVLEAASNFVLAANPTLALTTRAYMPDFGLLERSTVLV